MPDILIRNATIVTMNDNDDILEGDLRIINGRIAALGPNLPLQGGEEIIEAKGRVMIPGLIQTHVHLCQTLFRGQADDMELLDWLKKRIWPLEAAHDEESIYYSALLGIGELFSSGTTSIVDMETVHHTDFAFQAMAETGIRALSGKVMMDYGEEVPIGLQEETETSLQQSVDLLTKWNNYDHGRIKYAFCPRFVISCTEPLLIGVRDLSEQYDVHIHTHASENQSEIEIVEKQRGMRNIKYLDHIGLANPRLILAHCIWLDEEEKIIIRDRGVKVSHCPGSNLKLASGIADIPDLLARETVVGIGADGAPCNNNLDMFREMRLTSCLHKVQHGPRAMDARTVLRMATIGGAKSMGLEKEIGSIEIGKQADLALLNLNDFHTYPSDEVPMYGRIVYSATRADVETTIVAGKVVMRNKVMLTLDKEIVLRESNVSIRRLLARIPHLR